jgi:protein phosphatase
VVETGVDRLKVCSPRAVRRVLDAAIRRQNRHVHREGTSESGYVDMGATLAMLLVVGERAYVANVGDSRVYRLRNGRLRRLSVDHSVVSELLEGGEITPQEAEDHHALGVVTQYMGMPEEVEPEIRSLALRSGDWFLLCSDGLTDMVDEAMLEQVLTTAEQPQAACEQLVQAANKAGGTDNITLIVFAWEARTSKEALNQTS